MGKKKDKFRFLSNITRRDFISGSLIGAGSALLYANAPWAFSRSNKKQKPKGECVILVAKDDENVYF